VTSGSENLVNLSIFSFQVHFLDNRKLIELNDVLLELGLHFVPHIDEA